jgi:Leucine-rich repeat (LRR) protein
MELYGLPGSNTLSRLGNNTSTSYSSFVQVGNLSNWTEIYCNGNPIATLNNVPCFVGK